MPRKKRKIGFYYLTLNNDSENINTVFSNLLTQIISLDNVDRKFRIRQDKFCFLNSSSESASTSISKLTFSSASHNFRSPLLDRITLAERDNPKTLREGEKLTTHLVSKSTNGNVILLVEKSRDVLSINQIIDYLNKFLPMIDETQKLRFNYDILLKDDFLGEMDNLSRVVSTEIMVDKQLLGSASLDYSERLSSVQHTISIKVKANTRDSIADFANDLYAKLNGGENVIKKIRVVGRNNENNEVTINTDYIERQEYVMVDYDSDTGEIVTPDMFIEMSSILTNFN